MSTVKTESGLTTEQLKEALQKTVDLASSIIRQMPQKGITVSECQRTALSDALRNIEHNINGIEENDLIPNEDGPTNATDMSDVEDSLQDLDRDLRAIIWQATNNH